jgi:peptide/histidine transporter 3/4
MVDERKRLIPPRHDDTEEEAPCSCCNIPRFSNKILAKATILAAVAFERLAFYSISGNLILFLNGTKYNWSSLYALDASFFFLGFACISYFLGGIIADIKFGRFRVIVAAFIIYLIGYILFPMLSNENIEKQLMNLSSLNCIHRNSTYATDALTNQCSVLIFVALAIVGIGTGMLRANIAPFGADQVCSVKYLFI